MSGILAQLETSLGDAPWKGSARYWHDYLILFVVLGLVSLLALIWAAFFRKRPRDDFHRFAHHLRRHNAISNGQERSSVNGSPHRHHHRRRRRREHRPRNPTLAQTGGLPPVRTERGPQPLP